MVVAEADFFENPVTADGAEEEEEEGDGFLPFLPYFITASIKLLSFHLSVERLRCPWHSPLSLPL